MGQQRRRFLIATGALLAARLAHAQPRERARRIGWLASDAPTDGSAQFWRRELPASLLRLGFKEGENLVVDTRYAENKLERLPALAEELVRLKVELIVTFLNVSALAAKRATQSIPIVMATSTEPIASGLINSYARPGGNVTGVNWWAKVQAGKFFQIAKDVAPGAKRAALLSEPTADADLYGDEFFREVSSKVGLAVARIHMKRGEDLAVAFDQIAASRAEILVVQGSPLLRSQYRKIAAFALNRKLVSVSGAPPYIVEGGLLSYAPQISPMVERVASYITRILGGAKPADLPVEQPTKYELALNMKTANAMGLKLPTSFLAQVDRVIE